MAKKFKFPDPKDYPEKDPLVFCPNERMIRLYNEAHGTEMKRMAKKLNEWFINEANGKGWAHCLTLPEVQTKHGAGSVLFNPSQVKIALPIIHITLKPDK